MTAKDLLITLVLVAAALLLLNNVDQDAAKSLLVSLVRFAIGAQVFLLVTRLMDSRSGINFREWWSNAHTDDRAAYLGRRVLAVALLAAVCLA